MEVAQLTFSCSKIIIHLSLFPKPINMFNVSHLHPMLVHFPIALVVVGFLADTVYFFYKKEVCLSKTGFYLLVLGTLGAIAAWLAGFIFTSDMSGAAGQIRETHKIFASVTVSLLLITSLLRIILLVKKVETPGLKWIAFSLYGLATICVTITGLYGGTLVYDHMMPL
jgi:uncharacterized membrane protein